MKASWCLGIVVAVLIGSRAAVAADQPRTVEIAVTPKGFEPTTARGAGQRQLGRFGCRAISSRATSTNARNAGDTCDLLGKWG